MKQIVVISSSLRVGGNSDRLADSFIKGAIAVGHKVVKASIAGMQLQFCRGCLRCQTTHKCCMHDDMSHALDNMRKADIIVFATPVYVNEMSGQLKTFLDRTNPLHDGDYAFRDVYVIATAADNDKAAMDGVVNGIRGWLSYFPEATLQCVVYGTGLQTMQDITHHSLMMQDAMNLAMNIT